VTGLQHAALEVPPQGIAAELAFWACLGFGEVDVPETLAGRTHWVQREGTQIHLLHVDDREVVAAPEGHVAVVCDDYAATRGALLAAGHEVDDRTPHWGAERLFTRTPAGHRVEVMAFAPA
jgi:catechol 2,3-dioxygenase-like lactoylglutathione lyase family enzyme